MDAIIAPLRGIDWNDIGAVEDATAKALLTLLDDPQVIRRGPAVKDRFLVMDRQTGQSWWQYGTSQESAQDADRKRMTPVRLSVLTGWLRDRDLF